MFSSDRLLHKGYYRKGSVEKISGSESQGARREDGLAVNRATRKVTLTLKLTTTQDNTEIFVETYTKSQYQSCQQIPHSYTVTRHTMADYVP
jgi:hypothetical protein